MELHQLLVLALVQGLTEFLPISSSAHLILSPYLFGFPDQGLAVDVAVHLGSLFAVLAYFYRDVSAVLVGWFAALPANKPQTNESRLGWAVIVGVLPVMIAGLLLKSLVEGELRAPWVIGVTTILFGLLLGWADWTSKRERSSDQINLADALWIGLAQILALIPGTSRSGITITAGLMRGLTREAASRFSFLLAIPTILAAAILLIIDLIEAAESPDWQALGIGVVASAIAAYLCIHVFMKHIERMGMWPFVAYRLFLGLVIFAVIF